jgi:hypothetical protein
METPLSELGIAQANNTIEVPPLQLGDVARVMNDPSVQTGSTPTAFLTGHGPATPPAMQHFLPIAAPQGSIPTFPSSMPSPPATKSPLLDIGPDAKEHLVLFAVIAIMMSSIVQEKIGGVQSLQGPVARAMATSALAVLVFLLVKRYVRF